MSGDEITFGDVRVREPERRARPDRDRRFACVAYEVPGPADLPIFLDRRAADAIERHALSDTSVELGGILLGKECVDSATGQAFVWVSQSLEAKHYANTQASFTYTHDSWEEITRERDQRFPQYDIVGWYHTHPNFGIFLSHHDLFIHHNFFSQSLQVAYVVDPINQTRGFFQWRDGGMAQVQGYYLTADRGDRIALARLANDLEQLPNAEGSSGGAFSPRLEAELIKMLTTRHGQREMSSPVERAQFATIYGLLGVFLGAIGLATVLWLGQLLGTIQRQDESIQVLAQKVEDSVTRGRLVDELLEESVRKPVDFMTRYEKTTKELDGAKKELAYAKTNYAAIYKNFDEEKKERSRLEEKLNESEARVAKYKKEAADAAELNTQLAKITDELDAARQDLRKFDGLIDPETREVSQRSLVRTRYWMYGGWACSALLALAMAAAYFLLKPIPSAPLESESDAERPTHRIE